MTTRIRKIRLVIDGETAPQKNSQTFSTKSKSMVKSPQFLRWQRGALLQLRMQNKPAYPYEYAEIEIHFIHSDLRRRDGDNALASIQDLLVKAGIIKDDCWTRIGTPKVTHSLGTHAKCEINVFELEPIIWRK